MPDDSANIIKPSKTPKIVAATAANGNRAPPSSSGGSYNAANGGALEVHIEAPCCRDIHGREPPDGGMRAWLVMVSAFVCNGVIFGFINTYGIIHSLLSSRLEEQGDPEASSKAALVGSLAIGTTFLLSPVAGCLTDKIGLRLTTFIGGVLSAGGLFLSSFCLQNITAMYLTYGLMFGMGAALAYTPTLAILGHYFKRYLGKVSGFVTAGSSVFTVILPPTIEFTLKHSDLQTTLQLMSLVACFIILCSFVYKPLHPPPQPPQKKPGRSRAKHAFRSVVNVDIWKRKRYVIWVLCVPVALFGYFVPYVHMMKFVETTFPGKGANLPVMCIGVTSGIGRLIFGVIADLPGANRIYMQQVSLVTIGVMTMLLPATSSFTVLIVFALIMGLFDGCFITLFGPIAYELCGPSGATQAIGFVLGFSSLPLTLGPPIAGAIYDKTGSYKLPFILAGIPPLVGALVMCAARFVKDEELELGPICIVDDDAPQTQERLKSGANGAVTQNGTETKSHVPLLNGANGVNGAPPNYDRQTASANGSARLALSESLTDTLQQ